MKVQDLITNLLKGTEPLVTYTLTELLRYASKKYVTGIAVAKSDGMELYLAFVEGEPEGAIYVDEKGSLYGDKAVMKITDDQSYAFSEVKADIVDAIIMGCRLYEKSHLVKSVPGTVPEFGRRSSGVGLLTVAVRKAGELQNGVRVSVRKDGKIVGSDVTTGDGRVGFRIVLDEYDCIVQDRDQKITSRHITFNRPDQEIIIDI